MTFVEFIFPSRVCLAMVSFFLRLILGLVGFPVILSALATLAQLMDAFLVLGALLVALSAMMVVQAPSLERFELNDEW